MIELIVGLGILYALGGISVVLGMLLVKAQMGIDMRYVHGVGYLGAFLKWPLVFIDLLRRYRNIKR